MYVDFSTFQKQNCYSKGNTNFSAPNSHSIFLSRIFFLKFFVELHGESQLELFESCFPAGVLQIALLPPLVETSALVSLEVFFAPVCFGESCGNLGYAFRSSMCKSVPCLVGKKKNTLILNKYQASEIFV